MEEWGSSGMHFVPSLRFLCSGHLVFCGLPPTPGLSTFPTSCSWLSKKTGDVSTPQISWTNIHVPMHRAVHSTVYSRYIAVDGVQVMVPRYKWERDISGVCHEPKSGKIFQRVVSDNGAFVCLAANSACRQQIY